MILNPSLQELQHTPRTYLTWFTTQKNDAAMTPAATKIDLEAKEYKKTI